MPKLLHAFVHIDENVYSFIPTLHFAFTGHSRQKDKCLFLLYIHANSVINAKYSSNQATGGSTDTDPAMTSGLAMEFSVKELYAIDEIHSEKNIFRLLVGYELGFCISCRSLCYDFIVQNIVDYFLITKIL